MSAWLPRSDGPLPEDAWGVSSTGNQGIGMGSPVGGGLETGTGGWRDHVVDVTKGVGSAVESVMSW